MRQFFDPIRAFFVRAQLEGTWDLEKYSLVKGASSFSISGQSLIPAIRAKFTSSLSFFQSSSTNAQAEETIGEGAWKDRLEAEKNVERWLAEYPGTFITVQGPPGSGKVSLVSRILKDQSK